MLKKKWTYVSKNPEKAIKDQQINNKLWTLINNLPKSMVDSIVTPKVLQMDKEACDILLSKYLAEKIVEDSKAHLHSQERLINRNKIIEKHNS
jgi:hypothetical protein